MRKAKQAAALGLELLMWPAALICGVSYAFGLSGLLAINGWVRRLERWERR